MTDDLIDTAPSLALAAARLDGDVSLAVFRTLLDAAARPGLVVAPGRDQPADLPPSLAAALALVDLDQVVCVIGDSTDSSGWGALIAATTDARPVDDLGDADVVIARRSPTAAEIASLRVGSHEAPELGARLFISCRTLATDSGTALPSADTADVSTSFRVTGPGAPTPRRVVATGITADVPPAIAAANRSFPAGIDVWMIADDGSTVGVPRSTSIELIHDDVADSGEPTEGTVR